MLNAINFRQKFLRCKDKGVEFFYAFETFFDAITLGTIDFDTRTLGASIIVINILEIDTNEYTARNNILGVTSKHMIKSGMSRVGTNFWLKIGKIFLGNLFQILKKPFDVKRSSESKYAILMSVSRREVHEF